MNIVELNRKSEEECDKIIEGVVDDLNGKECESKDINNTLDRIEKEHGKEHAQVVGMIISHYAIHNRGIDLEKIVDQVIKEKVIEELKSEEKENESR